MKDEDPTWLGNLANGMLADMGIQRDPPKWTHWRLNKRLLRALATRYMTQEFTLAQVYEVYAESPRVRMHERYDTGELYLNPWSCMNARNTISKAAYEGILTRVRRGVYWFSVEGLLEYGPAATCRQK